MIFQVIKASGRALRVDLAENDPFRRVPIDSIIATWQGKATNTREAVRLAIQSFKEREL